MSNTPKFLILASLATLTLATASCGAPGYCKEGSYPDFYQDDWKPYCAQYLEHVENPGQFTVEEITGFFATHPSRVKELREKTMSYEKGVDACFQSNREQLEYRDLNSCLEYDDEQKQSIVNSWKARIEPWMENHRLRIGETRPKLGDAKRDATRLMRKTADALEFSREMDTTLFETWSAQLDDLDARIEKGKEMRNEWADLIELAEDNEALSEVMVKDLEPEIKELSFEIDSQREAHDDLLLSRRYLELAVYASGKPCPQGIKASKEERVAAKTLASKVKGVKGTKPRVSTTFFTDRREDIDYESFEGYVCGQRSRGNQFAEQPILCGVYRYKLERQKPASQKRKWSAWKAIAFEEAGPDAGVDCKLNLK